MFVTDFYSRPLTLSSCNHSVPHEENKPVTLVDEQQHPNESSQRRLGHVGSSEQFDSILEGNSTSYDCKHSF